MEKILIIDDNPGVTAALEILCEVHGIRTVTAMTPQSGLQQLEQDDDIRLVIQDMNFTADTTSGEEGRELFFAIRQRYHDLPVILLTAWTQLEMAVELVKAGAADYIGKPWDDTKLVATMRNLLELRELQQANLRNAHRQKQAQQALAGDYNLCGIIYRSEVMQRLLETAVKVARADVPVLITGPNGSGKEKIAEIIQANSAVRDQPFIKVNAGALPKDLLEAELFGAEAGAYTGANKRRIGRFEAADGGTLFLDEIGTLPLEGQIKLLRVIQSGEFERLGSTEAHAIKVRLITATNADLEAAIANGEFREDLYYRLNVIELRLPPLAERPEDVLPLANHFLGPDRRLSPETIRRLERYDWPGNVRQLQNMMRRAALLSSGNEVTPEDLELPSVCSVPRKPAFEPDRDMVERALADCHGVVAQAARQLGLSRQALYRRMAKYGIAD